FQGVPAFPRRRRRHLRRRAARYRRLRADARDDEGRAARARRRSQALPRFVMDDRVLDVARETKGFMPDDEGLALHRAGVEGGRVGALPEVGTYCGKSAVYLGAAGRTSGTVCFTVDHHRGSEENQAGWEHHDPEVVDPETGRMDTLPFFRRTMRAAGPDDVVVGIVGYSMPVARAWRTPLGLLFIDGGHAEDVAMADYAAWSAYV